VRFTGLSVTCRQWELQCMEHDAALAGQAPVL